MGLRCDAEFAWRGDSVQSRPSKQRSRGRNRVAGAQPDHGDAQRRRRGAGGGASPSPSSTARSSSRFPDGSRHVQEIAAEHGARRARRCDLSRLFREAHARGTCQPNERDRHDGRHAFAVTSEMCSAAREREVDAVVRPEEPASRGVVRPGRGDRRRRARATAANGQALVRDGCW